MSEENRRELYQTRIRRRHVRPAALHQMTRMCVDSCSTTALTPNTGKAANDAHMHILVKTSSVKPSKGVWLNVKKKKKMEWRTVRLTYAHQKDGLSWLYSPADESMCVGGERKRSSSRN